MSEIDELSVAITSSAEKAIEQLDTLIAKIGEVGTALNKSIRGSNLSGMTDQIKAVQSNVQAMSRNVSNSINAAFGNTRNVKKNLSSLQEVCAQSGRKAASEFVKNFAVDADKIDAVFKEFGRLAENTYSFYKTGVSDDNVVQSVGSNLHTILQENSQDIRVVDKEMQALIEDVKSYGHIFVSQQDYANIPNTDKLHMDGLLKQKLTTNPDNGGVKIEEMFASLKQFADMDLSHPADMVIALNNALGRAREGIKENVDAWGEANAAVKNFISDSINDVTEYERAIKNMVKASEFAHQNDTPILNLDKPIEELEKDVEKYKAKLLDAKNAQNDILNSQNPFSQQTGLDKATQKIMTYTNAIDKLQKKIDSLRGASASQTSSASSGFGIVLPDENQVNSEIGTLQEYEGALEHFEALFNNLKSQAGNEGTIDETKYNKLFEEFIDYYGRLEEYFPEAESTIGKYQNLSMRLDNLKEAVPFGKSTASYMTEEQKALSDAINKMADDAAKAEDVKKHIENAGQFTFKDSGNAKTYFFELGEWLTKIKSQLDGYKQKLADLENLGANPESQRWQAVEMNIQRAKNTISEYIKVWGEGYRNGGTDPMQGFAKSLDESQAKIKGIKGLLSDLKIIVPTDSLKQVQQELDKVQKKYNQVVEAIQRGFAKSGMAYGAGVTYKGQLNELEALRTKYDQLIEKQKELAEHSGFQLNTKTAQQALNGLHSSLTKLNNALNKAISRIGSFVKKMASAAKPTKAAKKSTDIFAESVNKAVKSLTRMANMMKLMITRAALRAVLSKVGQAIQDLAAYSDRFNASMSSMMATSHQLANSFVAMAAPLINALAPAINFVMNLLISLMNVINQFFSAFTGGSTWIKATKLTEDYAASVSDVGSAANSASKSLQGFDELNNLTSSSGGSGGGGGTVTDPADMFTTEDIDDKISDFANRVKDILSDLFDPLKKAWDAIGKKVIEAWKKALNSVWELIKSIGKDFLTMWGEEETLTMLENLLSILADIGLIVANIADKFREAWEYNQTGLHILENVRDVFAIIVQHLKNMADYTVQWSANLDFKPLLTAVEAYTASLKLLADGVGGIVEDFYEEVVLKFIKFMIEDDQGLPGLLKIFTDFNNTIDWEGLRSNIEGIWLALEPLLESVWTGFLNFVDGLADSLASFVNSQDFTDFCNGLSEFLSYVGPFVEKVGSALAIMITDIGKALVDFVKSDSFQAFLKSLEDWMAKVSPEEIASGLEKIAKALIALKIALVALTAIKSIATTLTALTTFFNAIKTLGSGISTAVSGIATAIGTFGESIALLVEGLSTGAFATLSEGMTYVFGAVATTLTGIVGIISGLVLAVTEFVKMWSNGWDVISTILEALGVALAAVGAVILGAPALIAAVVAAVVFAISQVVIALHDNWDAVVKFFTTTIPSWWEGTVLPIFEGMVTAIGDFFKGLPDTISNAFDTAKQTVSNGITAIVNFFSELPYWIGYHVGLALGKLVSWGADVTNWITTNVPKWIESIVKWWSELPGKIVTFLTEIINDIIQWGSDIVNWITTNVPKWIESIVKFFSELPGKIWNFLTDVVNKFGQWGANLVSWITSNVPGYAQKLASYFEELPDKFVEIGGNIIKGLWNGIKDAWEGLSSAVGDFCQGIVDGFKDGLDIHSPSKKAEEIGDYWIEGLTIPFSDKNGIEQVNTFCESFIAAFDALGYEKFNAIGQNVMNGFNEGIQSAASQSISIITEWSNTVENALNDVMSGDSMSQSGSNLITSFNEGITSNMESSTETITAWMDGLYEHILEYITEKLTGFQEYLSGMLSLDTLSESFLPVVMEILEQLFQSVQAWFAEEAMPQFMQGPVTEAFSADGWTTASAGMTEGLIAQWQMFIEQWTTEFEAWWNDVILVNFGKDTWSDLGKEMSEGLYSGFKNIVSNIGKIMNGMIDVFNNGCSKIKDAMNDLISDFNDSASELGVSKLSKVSFHKAGHVSVPSYSVGGFPEDGLFYANSSELVGKFTNGKTAVANNEEIVSGIKSGVKEAVSDILAPYLSDIANNTREVADKDFSIGADDLFQSVRKSDKEYFVRTGRTAFK